jgi:hypothetical protein
MSRILICFIAGFLAVLLFHQPVVAALNAAGMMPKGFPPYSLDPVPPLGVPTVVSKAFWGGLWAILLDFVLARTSGPAYWAGWIILGGVALSLVAIFLVPTLKGAPTPSFAERMPIYTAVNAAWGFGTALILAVLRR